MTLKSSARYIRLVKHNFGELRMVGNAKPQFLGMGIRSNFIDELGLVLWTITF